MNTNFIIRADYYSNEKIVPISITLNNNTLHIFSFDSRKESSKNTTLFFCCTTNGEIILKYSKGVWELK